MSNPILSVVIATFNRADLIWRTLVSYQRQLVSPDSFEIIIVDDNSSDALLETITQYSDGLDIKYIRLTHNGKLRAPNTAWRTGMAVAKSDVVAITHPEIMIPREGVAIAAALGNLEPMRMVRFSGYFISEQVQKNIDTVDWGSLVENIKTIPGFDDGSHSKLGNAGITCFFAAMHKKGWEWFGGLQDTELFGLDDRDFHAREVWLQKNAGYHGCLPINIWCYHQWHPILDKHDMQFVACEYHSESEARLLSHTKRSIGEVPMTKIAKTTHTTKETKTTSKEKEPEVAHKITIPETMVNGPFILLEDIPLPDGNKWAKGSTIGDLPQSVFEFNKDRLQKKS